MKIFRFRIQIMIILIFKHLMQNIKNQMKKLTQEDQIVILVIKQHFQIKIINLNTKNLLKIIET